MAQMTINDNTLTAQRWAGDFLDPEHLIPGGAKVDEAQWYSGTPYTITVNDADAARGDTTLGVDALGVAIPADALLDFGELAAADFVVTVNDADAARGDTTLTVDALGAAVPAGTFLNFGELAADAYTITLNDASVSAGDTAITVAAIGVAMPAGTVLDFGTHGSGWQELAMLSADAASGATELTVEPLMAEITNAHTADYPGTALQQIVQVTADAAAAATSLTVEPLAGPIEDNATANYPGAVLQQLVQVTVAAAAAATSLTIEPLAGPVEDNATATYYASADGTKPIPGGTLIGRTFAERAAGITFGPAATDGSDDEFFVVALDVTDAVANDDVELYRPGSVVKEDALPDWSTLTAQLKAQLRAAYVTTVAQV